MAIRRRYTGEFGLQMVREHLAVGTSRAALARLHDIATDQVLTWLSRQATGPYMFESRS